MDMGVVGRGGARRRTRRRANARARASTPSPQPAAAAPAPAVAPAPASDSPTAMIEMLKVLHKEGILNDAEFQAKKLLVVEKIT